MWWLACLTVLMSALMCQCENILPPSAEEFTSMLQDAAAQVLAQHSAPYEPPAFSLPQNFMRSFRPGTGVGNREELLIDNITSLWTFTEYGFEFSSFHYKRFQSEDYIAGISKNNVVLNKLHDSAEYLTLSQDSAVFQFPPASVGASSLSVKDVVLYTLFTEFSDILYSAILVETARNSIVYIYEIKSDGGELITSIDLDSLQSPASAKKLAYVQSYREGSLVVLAETTPNVPDKVTYKHQGSIELRHYIKVDFPSAVDLVTFTVQGYGYIAVTNASYCAIYVLNEYTQNHTHFDRIYGLSNIMDLEYFRMGFYHYLAVVHNGNLNLYTWSNEEFSLKQEIIVFDAAKVHASAVDTCRDEVILMVVTRAGDLKLYIYSGQNEKFEITDKVISGHHIVPGSVTSFSQRNNQVIVLGATSDVYFQGQFKAFVLETSMRSLKDALIAEGEKVSSVMKELQSMLNKQNEEIERMKKIMETAVRTHGDQRITGVQHFHNIVSSTSVAVEEVNEFLLEWEDSTLTLEDYRRGTEDLEKEVDRLEELVQKIERDIPDIVLKNQHAVITGQKIFKGGVYAQTLQATSLNIEKVGDMNLAQLQKDVYRLDKPQQIQGTLTFKEPLTITGNLDVEGRVNGIDISEDVMTTNTEQVSNAQMIFTTKLLIDGDLDVTGKVNDIDISEEVVTLHGTHHITGHKNFTNGIEVENVKTKLLDGVHIDDLYKRAFTVSGAQHITGDATFSAITSNDILLKGTLNGYDVKELDENIVRIDRPATISGYKIFTKDVTVDGDLFVSGTVNGLRIPDDLFLTDIPQTVTGVKEFLGHVSANEIFVQGTIDGVKVPEDVVTLSGNEEIPSTLYFTDGIVAQQNILVEGHVDGVDISEIARQAMTPNETEFTHAVFLGPVTINGDLTVKGLVNKVDLNSLVDDIVFKDENQIVIGGEKKFSSAKVGKVVLDRTINGYNINVDFMTTGGHQQINGTKTFKEAVTFESIWIMDGMINGVNLSDIYDQRIKSVVEESELDQEIVFADHVIVDGNLSVRGTVSGLHIPNDIVLKDARGEISNKHFANKVTVDNLIVDGDIRVNSFNGRDLTQFYKDRITLNTNQTIPGDILIGNSTAQKVTIHGLVNGLNITEFADNVMSKTKPQTVKATKEFSGDVTVHGPITTKEGVNGFSLSDIHRRAFKLTENNVVSAPLEFEDNVTFTALHVSEDINGINITRLSEDSLKKSGIQHVKGDTIFNAGFHVEGDILSTNVNGLVVPDDVLLKSTPQTITGQFTFGSVGIGGDLSIKGSINGLDLSEIAPKLAKIESETVIASDITFTKPIYVENNIEVSGTINEINLKTLFDNVLMKSGDQNVTGSKVFRGNVTILGDMDVEFVNGINWKEFLDDVVWKNVPQVIHASKTFEDEVSVEKDVFVSGLVHAGLVNGIDLKKFVDEAVYVDTPTNITGPITFKYPVEIQKDFNAELINGLRLKTDVITIACQGDAGPQIITGEKSFQYIKVYGDVHANKVNSYELMKFYLDTLLTEGNQNVTGNKTISGDVIFKKNVHPSTVNGMILSRDLVTLDTEQEIRGDVIFKGDVFVEKDLIINGLLNGVDLQNLSREAVYLKTDQVIEGSYSLQNAVVSGNVEVGGMVNGIDLVTFEKNVTDFLRTTKESIAIMNGFAEDHCEEVRYLQESLEHSYYSLDSFVIHQVFEFPASFIDVRSERDASLVYFDKMAAQVTSVQNTWNSSAQRFDTVGFSTSSIVKTLSYAIGSIQLVINIGINSKDSSVTIQGLSAAVLNGFSDASVVVRNGEAIVTILLLQPQDKKTCDAYLVKDGSTNLELMASVVVGKEAESIVTFELSGVLYMAVASSSSHYSRGSKVYTLEKGAWKQLQDLHVHSSSVVKHFTYQNYHYLAFASDAPLHEMQEPKSIRIYRNSGPDQMRFMLFQKVNFDDVTGMDVFQFGDISQLHLVAWNETMIQIFVLEGESGMQSYLTIHGHYVKDVKPLLVANELYLLAGQQDLKMGYDVKSILYKASTKGFKYEPYSLEYC